MKRLVFLTLFSAPWFSALGCGSGNTVWVTGKLVKGGATYTPPTGQLVDLTFVGLEIQDASGKTIKDNEPFQADLDQTTGKFSVPGKDGRGIPPGKYRVAVTQRMTRETFEATVPKPKKGAARNTVNRETDMLGDKFSVENSPIVREVRASQDLTVDLDNPTQQ